MVLAAGWVLGVRLGEGRRRKLDIGVGDLERLRRSLHCRVSCSTSATAEGSAVGRLRPISGLSFQRAAAGSGVCRADARLAEGGRSICDR